MSFPGSTSGKEPACQCRGCKRCGFNPWVRKIPWRRVWQPTPVFLPGESPWTEEPGGLQSIGSQRVGHNLATEQQQICIFCSCRCFDMLAFFLWTLHIPSIMCELLGISYKTLRWLSDLPGYESESGFNFCVCVCTRACVLSCVLTLCDHGL